MPSIIRPTDFAEFESTTRTLGHWDPATLKRLVPFLEDLEVVVVVSDSGHAQTGRITGYYMSTMTSDYPHIALTDEHGTTLFRVSNLGEIMVVDHGTQSPKFALLKALSEETNAARKAVQEHIGTDFPAEDPRKGPRRWNTTLMSDGVQVVWGDASLFAQRWYVRDGEVYDEAAALR